MGSCALTCVSMQKKTCSILDHLVVTPASSIDIVCFWHFVWSRPDEHCAKTTADGQGWCAGFSLVATCRYVEWHRSQWRNRSNRFDLARNGFYFFIFFHHESLYVVMFGYYSIITINLLMVMVLASTVTAGICSWPISCTMPSWRVAEQTQLEGGPGASPFWGLFI